MANPKIVKGCLVAIIVTGVLAAITTTCSFIACGQVNYLNDKTDEMLTDYLINSNINHAKEHLEMELENNPKLAPEKIISYSIYDLNDTELIKNFIDESKPAYSKEPAPGTVTIEYDTSKKAYIIKAYGENLKVLQTETFKIKE